MNELNYTDIFGYKTFENLPIKEKLIVEAAEILDGQEKGLEKSEMSEFSDYLNDLKLTKAEGKEIGKEIEKELNIQHACLKKAEDNSWYFTFKL